MSTTNSVVSLAVKHRPHSILGLVGQDHVVTQVRGMVKSKRFPSAILISGDSGCGKTTLSRIISLTVNCKNLNQSTLAPCGECHPCKLGKSSPDYMEVNIGDTRGIDDIRGLTQSAKSMPVISNNRIIVLDEVHQLLAAGANALLKSLEDSPPRTLWILATTNPEKLLPTIVGRCLKLNLTTIEPDIIAKRLRIIAKREGVDLKTFEGGADIVRTIVDLSNGRMRDAISILESALFAIQSSKDMDAKKILQNFLNTGEANLEQLAADLLIALLTSDVKTIVRVARTSGNCRGILQKLRWIIQYLLDNAAGVAKYTPYGAKLFARAAKEQNLRLQLTLLIQIQYLLVEIEVRFNSSSVDESVLFLSMLGNFAVERK